MENKHVGWLILGVSGLIIGIIFLFNNAMKEIISHSCPLDNGGTICPAFGTINQQTYLSLGIVSILIIVALVIMFQKPKEKIIVKTVKEKKKPLNLEGLDKDEKMVVDLLMKENNAVFQADLMEKLEIGKVKATRLLDKLESKQLIERKRRGMNNIVVLKD